MSFLIELIWWWSDTSTKNFMFFILQHPKQRFYIEQVEKHLVLKEFYRSIFNI